ncbi:hypothetical protein HanRHA438_Chr03g0141791 [Helianthus annuus]|nr:hypothetical protein HanRHA438_Chr03g0141791 [Helianthus annuus]
MFKPVRWRSEKNKIKGVFRLQFHATQQVRCLLNCLREIFKDFGVLAFLLEEIAIFYLLFLIFMYTCM